MIDIEAVLIAWLEDNVEDVRASNKTPSDLDDQLPWVLVRRTGGPYDGFRVDRPTVDIETFAATSVAAADLALHLQHLLHTLLAGAVTSGTVFSRVETPVAPHWVPYDNPNMARYTATNRFAVHPA